MERRALDADGVVAAPLVVVRRRGVAGETLFRRLAARAVDARLSSWSHGIFFLASKFGGLW
jgi:hypothetical protein